MNSAYDLILKLIDSPYKEDEGPQYYLLIHMIQMESNDY
jgi:hypothetical protein